MVFPDQSLFYHVRIGIVALCFINLLRFADFPNMGEMWITQYNDYR